MFSIRYDERLVSNDRYMIVENNKYLFVEAYPHKYDWQKRTQYSKINQQKTYEKYFIE